jgi:heme/copper-type cytochrome/quinol oxidase subunit 4
MKAVMVILLAFKVTVIPRTSTFLHMTDSEEGATKSDEPYDECYPYSGW